MKKLKLFLAAIAIAFSGLGQAFAADWAAVTLEAGKHYFLNVGANKWLGAGNSWGTQASLLAHPEYLTVVVDGTNYKLDTQVSNGGEAHYFNGSYMDNSSPVSLTIETDGTNYSIASGATYYGFDGTSTVLATSDNRDSKNFQWQIFNEAQMRARLEAASSSNPVDATYLILNQGFGRNNRNAAAWTMDASNKNLAGGDNTNLCAESWHSTFTLSQKLENVPNGLYTLTAQGFYRQDGTDNDNLPYFYINDAKGTFPILSGSENNMTDASNSFTAGKYTISPISVLVTDGTITLGAKNEVNTSLWCIFDNFVLTFYGDTDPLEASKNQIKTSIDEAEAIDVTGLPTAVVDEMKAVVASYKTVYESYTAKEEFDNAIAAIQTVVNKVKAYNNAKACIAELKALLEATNVYTKAAYDAFYANVTKFENAELTTEEANALNAKVFGTRGWRATVDVDDFLISAWGVAPRTWDGELHVNTWSTEGDNDGSNFVEPFLEYWFGDGDVLAAKTMTATVPGLKAGQEYEVSALVRVRNSDGKTIVPGTILFQVGEGASVDVTAGKQIGTSQLYIGTYTANGTADAEGNLVIKFNVAEGSNVSWFAFKNVKYTEAAPAYTEVANIADVKKLANGTEFKLTLKDAKVTVQTFSMRGMMILLEDATGAIDVSEMSALEGFVEQNIINGTLYGVYRNEFGTIGLGLSENTEKSEITVQPGVVTPTKFTIADVKNEANYYKFVELNDCKAVYDEENYTWWAFVGTDSIAITDRFNKAVNWETGEPEIPANIKSMTGIVMFDGEKWVICPYAYGENKAIIAAVVAAVENFTLTPQGTIIWGNGDDSKGETPNTNGDNNYYNASATTWNVSQSAVSNGSFKNNNSPYGGSYILISKFDGSSTLSGKMVQKAILNFTSVCTVSGKNSDVQVAAIGTNWDPATATWNTVNTAEIMNAVQIHDGTNVKTSPKDFVIDVTDLLAADEDKVFGIAIYTKTAREQKISNLSLEVQAIDASASAEYLVKYATAEGTVVRVDTITGTTGGQITVSDEAKQPFYNADKSEKYIYVADDAAGKTIAEDGSTVVTVTVRLAEQFRYSVVAVDESGELLQTLNTDFNFEGESFKVPYNKYVLNYSDSTLYASDATDKEYNKSVTLSEDGAQFKVTFKKTDIKNVIYLQEAEDIWGLTKATNGNTGIRSSNSASAYAAEEDVEITGLSTGKYKLTAVICDATKNAGSTFKFAVAEDTVASITATAVNWFEGTSSEFTVIGNYVPLKLLKGGSNNQAVDFVYIQKTGGVPSVVVENIADVKKVKSGTPVNLKLNNAKVTVQAYAMMGSFTVIEDATGAIPLSGNMALEGIYEKQALNGNLYVTYVNEWGSEQLDLADSTMYSNFTSEAAEVAPVEMTYAAVKDSANMYRFVKLGACKTVFDEEMWMYYAVSGTDTLAIVDRFNKCLNWDTYETEIPAEVEYMTGLIMFDGEQWVIYPYAYGEDKAIVGVAQPEDIVVNVTEGEISAAVEAEKAKVAKVGNITINLTEGVAYTASSSIVAPAGLVINGNGAVITSSAELVVLPAEPTVAANEAKAGFYEITSPIVIENVHVKAAKAIVKSKAKYLVSAININNSIIEMTAQSAVVDFSGGQMGYPTVLSVNNSTVWSAQNTNKPFFTSQSGNSPKDINNAAEEKQTISIENSTFYNIAYNKNFNELRQKGQKFLVFTIKNNIIVNSGKANFLQGMDGGQSSANPTWTVENNTFGTLVDGAFTDVSASQSGCGEVVNSVVTNPGFKDVAAGDFTVYAGSEQAKQKIGDPRWLVEFDETLTGIDGINAAATLNGAVYTINGIKVREAGETLKGLSKGMYIINGKKYVVK